jgi:serine phosphatase RsbU (regulator of sigma subunit)
MAQMTSPEKSSPSAVEWGVATVPLPGQTESGDLHLVITSPKGVLVAAVDGLGHGAEAATAARLAVTTLREHAEDGFLPLIERCHEALKGTRGAAISLAFLDSLNRAMTWLGVGNVEGFLLRADQGANPGRDHVMLLGGTLGYKLPTLRATVTTIAPGDTLVFATDGIRHGWELEVTLEDEPQRIADRICSRYSKGTDDALVLVARYRGGAP